MNNLSILNYINANLQNLEIDEIKELLKPLINGLTTTTPVFPSGIFLYRARKIDHNFNKENGIQLKDLLYPPKQYAKLGRLNRDNESIFYCATLKEVVYFELPNLANDDEIILSFWCSSQPMLVNNVGYTQHVFEKLGAKRTCPEWSNPFPFQTNIQQNININPTANKIMDTICLEDKKTALLQAISKAFMCTVNDSESYKYKLTVALGELHLSEILNHNMQFAGIIYPTVRMCGNADNFALLPDFVDKYLSFKQAQHIRIDSKEGTKFTITHLDSAREFLANGNLKWLGQLSKWSIPPGSERKFRSISGTDQYGDYLFTTNGKERYHWRVTDTLTDEMLE